MIRKKIFRRDIVAVCLGCLGFLWYFALGIPVFKNMWYTSPSIPFVGGVLFAVPLILAIVNCLKWRNGVICYCVCFFVPVAMFGHFVLFAYIISKLTYFFIAGTPYFITAALLGLVAFFVFAYPKLTTKLKRIVAVGLAMLITICCLVCLFNLTVFTLDGAAVFAVDDEYQIAFSTSHQSVGFITIDGVNYYDQTNGENNVSKLHKISVPSALLEEHCDYTVHARSVAVATAYLPSKGATLSKQYTFRPVDDSDGIQIYNLSDTHECIGGPVNAASYWGINWIF